MELAAIGRQRVVGRSDLIVLGAEKDCFTVATHILPEDGRRRVYGVDEDGVPAFPRDIEYRQQMIPTKNETRCYDKKATGRAST